MKEETERKYAELIEDLKR
jgi:hypothetical protein